MVERRLEHENGEARAFYASLPKPVRVGMEATGYAQWFERLLAELRARIVGRRCRRDSRRGGAEAKDGRARCRSICCDLLLQKRFPRIWIPSLAERDVRQLLLHRVQAGLLSHFGEEPVARAGHEPGHVPEEEAVHSQGARGAGTSFRSVRGPAGGGGSCWDARPAESIDRRAGPGGAARSWQRAIAYAVG